MIKHILKITWRNIRQSKIYTLINIVGLSLGITCTLVITL
jgi:putative ABC transport system permease protein